MGLDMYLTAAKTIYNYTHNSAKERKQFARTVKAAALEPLISPESLWLDVRLRVAYWRKSNQIHNWFVQNVQGGIDECQSSYVSREDLQTLVDLCKEVLEQPDKAAELLPVESGFFFGATDYGEWYFDDLRDTIAQLEPLLQVEGVAFYYQASW